MELLLEAFVLFSCLMFWVVFFHKKGTLAKLKKIEASIQSKISILEDLASKYPQTVQPPQLSTPLTETQAQPTVSPLIETDAGSASVSQPPPPQAGELPSRWTQGFQIPKSSKIEKKDEEPTKPFLTKEKVLSKVKDSANIFEQKIENMLRHYGALKTEDISESESQPEPQPQQMQPSPSSSLSPKPAVATPPLHAEPLRAEHQQAQESMYDGDEQLEQALKEDKIFQKQTQVVVPRTKPIESFEDVINLSKALEQEQTKNRG